MHGQSRQWVEIILRRSWFLKTPALSSGGKGRWGRWAWLRCCCCVCLCLPRLSEILHCLLLSSGPMKKTRQATVTSLLRKARWLFSSGKSRSSSQIRSSAAWPRKWCVLVLYSIKLMPSLSCFPNAHTIKLWAVSLFSSTQASLDTWTL